MGFVDILVSAFNGDEMKIITGLSAIFGLILSVINFFTLQRERMMNITIRFEKLAAEQWSFKYKNEKVRVTKVAYHFINNSQLPISITRVCIRIGDRYFESEPRSYIMERSEYKTNGTTISSEVITNDKLAKSLNSLAAKSGYLAFLIPIDLIDGTEKSLFFKICTNRGKPYEGSFILNEEVRLYNNALNKVKRSKRHKSQSA